MNMTFFSDFVGDTYALGSIKIDELEEKIIQHLNLFIKLNKNKSDYYIYKNRFFFI